VTKNKKLDANQVVKILKLIKDGLGNVEIAERFGVARQTVLKIKNGEVWKSIPRD